MMIPRCRTAKRANFGFTLVELMVTIAVAMAVLASVYALYQRGTNTARIQAQIAQTQTQLRSAMDHLWRDVNRAGFRATANSDVDTIGGRICFLPPNALLRGLSIERGVGHVAFSDTNTLINPSALTLFGDLFSPRGHLFRTAFIDAASRQVQLQLDELLATISKEQFEALFRPGARWVRVFTDDGLEWYAPIEAALFESLTLQLGAAPGPGLCQGGLGDGQDLSPVGWVRYRLVEDTATGDLLGEGGILRTTGKTDLVREELDEAGEPVPGTALVVAEYAVDLQFYDFIFDDTALGDTTTAFTVDNFVTDVVDDSGGNGKLSRTDPSAQPDRLRFLTAKVSVRSAEEDRDYVFLPRDNAFGPLNFFDADPQMVGAARVFSSAKRLELRNFWLRRQQR